MTKKYTNSICPSISLTVFDVISPLTLSKVKQYAGFVFSFIVCIVLTGCTLPASQMVPTDLSVHKKINQSVSLSVTSKLQGEIYNRNGPSIASALQTAIEKYGVFSTVVRSGNSDFDLEVQRVQLSPIPIYFLDVTLTTEMLWTLKHVQTNKTVWQESIKSQYTTPFSDSSFAAWRLRKAELGAVRENIKIGLEKISALSL